MRLTHYDEHKKRWQINSDKICDCINLYCTKAADAIEDLQAGEKKFLRNIDAAPTIIPAEEGE